MSHAETAGFWSYAHEDDAADSGGILELAAHIRSEYSLLTGEPLALFIDRTGIEWGEEWRQRIENALVETTFFIPIITLRYFKRPECRKELLAFVGQAQSLGVSELMLPILYTNVPTLSEDNDDEAVALVARTQYFDWRRLRIAGAASSDYKQGIHSIAQRLIDIGDMVNQRRVEREMQQMATSEDEEADLATLLGRAHELLPEWMEAVVSDQFTMAQHHSTWDLHQQRMKKLRGAPPSARFAELQRFAMLELRLAEQTLSDAQVYLAKTVELDPIVLAVLRIMGDHPESLELIDEIAAAVAEAIHQIEKSNAAFAKPGTISIQQFAKERAHVSGTMRKMGNIYEAASALAEDANLLVENWREKLNALGR